MTNPETLARLLDTLADARLLCVGDVILDTFVYGTVERISPEGPIPVLSVERQARMLGGAGNVVRNAVALGASATLLSVVGEDDAGREVSTLLVEEAGRGSLPVVEPGRPTTVKTRYVANRQQLLRADRETTGPIAEQSLRALVERFRAALPESDAVVLSDYRKGALTPALLSELIGAVRATHLPIVVDPKGTDYGRYRGASVITPNLGELASATGLPVGTDDEVVAAARSVARACSIPNVVVTRGPRGITLVAEGEEPRHLSARVREVFDVSGAGDTVVAMLAVALAARVPLEEAAALANIAAGIVVGKVGTSVAHLREIRETLREESLLSGGAKVVDVAQLLERAYLWRAQGAKIGFASGCFDLLDPGHVSLIAQARASCDHVVVGLYSDGTIARRKGPGWPIQSESARAVMVGSLTAVDAVVVLTEDTPDRLIGVIAPALIIEEAEGVL